MVEKPICFDHTNDTAPTYNDPTFTAYVTHLLGQNGLSYLNDEDTNDVHVYPLLSRLNHSCVPNACHHGRMDGVKVVKASHRIALGQEICVSYLPEQTNAMRSLLQDRWNFQCKCLACSNPDILNQLKRMDVIDRLIVRYGELGHVQEAMVMGDQLIQLYNEMEVSPIKYTRTYYDMFQMTIRSDTTMTMAMEYIAQAIRESQMYYGETPPTTKLKRYQAHPEQHPHFLQDDLMMNLWRLIHS